jgi:CRISPR-associated protein Cmr1
MGFGVIQVDGSRIDTQPLYDWLMTTSGSDTYSDLSSLQNIFLAKIQPKDPSSSFNEKDTFNLKYDLRQLFRTKEDTTRQQSQGNKPIPKKEKEISGDKRRQEEELRHFIMGTVEDDRQAAKIKISRSYNDNKLMRVWGWVPTKAEVYKNGWDREKVVDAIYQHLTANYTLHDWHEMNLTRDLVKSSENDPQSFLRSLLKIGDCDGVSQK